MAEEKKDGGFLKKVGKGLVGLVVEIEEDPKNPESSTQANTQSYNVNTPVINNTSQTVQGNLVNQEELEKFKQYFNDLFKNSNLPGPDYFEFSQMVDSMISDVPLATAFKSSFKALSHGGLTKDKLVATAKQYLEIVQNDAVNFNNALVEKSGVADKLEANNKDLENTIKQKQELIAAMSLEIEQHRSQILSNQNEIANVANKINNKKNSYNIASQNMVSRINEAIKNIENYIS